MRMRTVVLRLARLAAVLIVVSMLCFLSLNLLPGDPARAILGESGTPSRWRPCARNSGWTSRWPTAT